MPFGGRFDEYFETVFRPAIEAAGLRVHRADDLYRPSVIVNDIWAYTTRCSVVLADLTTKNPNVFYELGLAHALAKPAILVSETMDDVPFDLRSLRVLVYDKHNPRWGDLLAEGIRAAISEVLVSPAAAVLPTFLQADPTVRPSISQHDKELLQIRQELDGVRQTLERLTSSGAVQTTLSPSEPVYRPVSSPPQLTAADAQLLAARLAKLYPRLLRSKLFAR